jgi:hypothetical protein
VTEHPTDTGARTFEVRVARPADDRTARAGTEIRPAAESGPVRLAGTGAVERADRGAAEEGSDR